jgi:ubiquinone/menaquinone biosynthesis C-methylase UbiE
LRANGSRERIPDDQLAKQSMAIAGSRQWIASSLCSFAMTRTETIMLDHEDRVRDEFTRQAETFSASGAITDAALTQRFIDALGEAARGSVLDVACGPGILSAAIAETAREVVAFDLTPQMLKKAAQRCAEAGVDNVTFREGNATGLPFADAAFDAAVTRLSVHHFDRPSRAMSEIFRVLRPGGGFVIADVISSEVPAEAELQNAIEILRDPSHVRMLPGSELTSLVRGAGFAIESLATWDKPREFEEWMGIVNDASRVPPLRAVVRALAHAGVPAGMGLCLDGEKIRFFHRWNLIAARKPVVATASPA